jgi:HemY protein
VVGVALVVITLLYRFWRGALGAPSAFLARRHYKRREDGYRALALGMAAAAAGDPEEAKRLARRADSLLQDPDLTRLLSAQAASLNGDRVSARRYFDALVENDETAFLGLTGLMRQAMADGDDEAVLNLAERAHKIRPDSTFVVESLFRLQSRGGRWEEAQATLFDAVRRQIKTEAQAVGHRTAIFTARAMEMEAEGRVAEAGNLAEKALLTTPTFVPAAILRARILERDGKNRKAVQLLENLWRREPHPELVLSYLKQWPIEAPLERLKRIQHLTSSNATSTESRLAIATTALEAKLWGEARRNLSALSEDEITVRVCRLMARLEEDEHGDAAAARRWSERADTAPQDAAWTCGTCGAVAQEWSAICGNCGGFDSISWKQPPRVSILPHIPAVEAVLEDEDEAGEEGVNVVEVEIDAAPEPLERRAS